MTGNLKMLYCELINICNNGIMDGLDTPLIGVSTTAINFTADK